MAKGKAAFFIGSPDIPHDYAYVPDIGRAAADAARGARRAYGQAWHVPCAPTRTTREILRDRGATRSARQLKLNVLPESLLGPLGLVVPFLREAKEMRFTFDRPYRVEAEQVRKRLLVRSRRRSRRACRETALAFREAGQRGPAPVVVGPAGRRAVGRREAGPAGPAR